MKLDYKDIGATIKKARISRNWTQQSLADECKISRTYLADIESGRLLNVKLFDGSFLTLFNAKDASSHHNI